MNLYLFLFPCDTFFSQADKLFDLVDISSALIINWIIKTINYTIIPDAFADAEAKEEDVEVKLSSILESEAPWFKDFLIEGVFFFGLLRW